MLSGKAATLGHAAVITVLLAASITAQTGDPDTCAPFVMSNGVLTCSASGPMRQQLRTATFIAGSAATGETIAQAIALEVATAPIGSSSGGFIHSFDVRTRRTDRTSGTFGPSFAERGLTIGRGRFSAGASFASRTYDSVDGLDLDDLPIFRFVGGTLPITASSMNIEATTRTLALFGHYGVWDNFDVGVMVPFVDVSVTGASRIFDQSARELQRVGFDGSSSGLGDIAVFGKYRFFHVGQPASMDAPPNGDLAAMATLRLPSGNSEDMLGLGVTRVAVTFIGSATIHRLAPHINVGYEFWSDSIDFPSDFQSDAPDIFVQGQFQYAIGTELEVHPRLTVIGDFIGRYQRGGGRLGYQPSFFPTNQFNVLGADALVGIPFGFSTVIAVPGAKWNFHDEALLTGNVLIPVTDGGLKDNVTLVIGVDWGF